MIAGIGIIGRAGRGFGFKFQDSQQTRVAFPSAYAFWKWRTTSSAQALDAFQEFRLVRKCPISGSGLRVRRQMS